MGRVLVSFFVVNFFYSVVLMQLNYYVEPRNGEHLENMENTYERSEHQDHLFFKAAACRFRMSCSVLMWFGTCG